MTPRARQINETTAGVRIREDVQAEIHAGAQDAFGAVWAKSVIPTGGHFGALSGVMMAVEDRAHAARDEATRSTCAELGIDPRDYYRANPENAVVCEPSCLDKWSEISMAVYQGYSDDDFICRLDREYHQTDTAPRVDDEHYSEFEAGAPESAYHPELGR